MESKLGNGTIYEITTKDGFLVANDECFEACLEDNFTIFLVSVKERTEDSTSNNADHILVMISIVVKAKESSDRSCN